MKTLLKFLVFILFAFVLGTPEKGDTSDGESINNCEDLKQDVGQEPKNGRDAVIKCDCGVDRDVNKTCCSPSELNKHTTQGITLDKTNIEQVQNARCTEPTDNSIYCYLTQKIKPDLTSTLISTAAEFKYSDECTISNQELGAVKSDDTSYTTTHCCGIEAGNGYKIYGGTETAIDEYPWLAMLEYERPFLCGGTLISSFYVLTAAHCLVSETLKPRGVISVRLGEYNTKNDGRDCVEAAGAGLDCTDGAVSITISNIIVHPEYNNINSIIVHVNDIGLLRLNESSPYTDFIRPICLPSSDVTQAPESKYSWFYAAGWGAVSNYQLRSDVKLQVELSIIDQKVCENLYSINGKPIIWDKQFCAGGEPNKDTCKGDSGGPLIYSDDDSKIYQIVGITSFGILKCGRQGRPSIYTKVIEYVPWIIANMKPLII